MQRPTIVFRHNFHSHFLPGTHLQRVALVERFECHVFDEENQNAQIDEIQGKERVGMMANKEPGQANCRGKQVTENAEWRQPVANRGRGIFNI